MVAAAVGKGVEQSRAEVAVLLAAQGIPAVPVGFPWVAQYTLEEHPVELSEKKVEAT